METFISEGKQNTPVAVVQNGTRPDERYGLGTVGTITGVVNELGLEAPAIIIIGEVVKEHPQWNHQKKSAIWIKLEEQLNTIESVA